MRVDFLCLVACALASAEVAAPEAAPVRPPPPKAPAKRKLPVGAPVIVGGGLGIGLLATPAVRRAVGGSVRRLLGRDGLDFGEAPKGAAADEEAAAAAAPPKPSTADQMMADAAQFQLTPEKLAEIAELNPKLEAIGEQLTPVPVFTAAVGNGTSPLTVPTEDGMKLAYFFTEHADADAFLRAVKENANMKMPEAHVIGVSLSDIIRAYASPQAKEAKESFVLIPTMAEVAAARQLMRMAGVKDGELDAGKLGPGSGLIPVFWSEALAVQTAGGKQRKVLFFRVGDLDHMWKNLSAARQAAGELDELPEGPTVQVSDLQTMAGLLVEANKTDDVMFLPSSTALRRAQGQALGRAKPADGVPSSGGGGGGGEEEDTGFDEGDDDDTFV